MCNDQGSEAALYESRLGVGIAQHGEEKGSWKPSSTFRGPTRKMGTSILAGLVAIGLGLMALN